MTIVFKSFVLVFVTQILLSSALDVTKSDTNTFDSLLDASQPLKKVNGNFQFTEGPVWTQNGFLFSDIPGNKIYRWNINEASASEYLSPSSNQNGMAWGKDGKTLYTCKHTGKLTTIDFATKQETDFLTTYKGNRFNSPNDVVVKSDGSVWFSDPGWGCCSGANGVENDKLPQKGEYIYRVSPDGSRIRRVAPSNRPSYLRPNGLAFSLDEKKFYYGNEKNIMVCDVIEQAPYLSGCRVFTEQTGSDGLRLDSQGNVWTTYRNKINIYNPRGSLIGSINVYNTAAYPQQVTNIVFGGPRHRTLFITGGNQVFYLETFVSGDPRFRINAPRPRNPPQNNPPSQNPPPQNPPPQNPPPQNPPPRAPPSAPAGSLPVTKVNANAFNSLVDDGQYLQRVPGDFQFTEGPVWIQSTGFLFSDIPGNKIYRWNFGDSSASEFFSPSGNQNGMALSRDGKSIFTCKHSSGKITKIDLATKRETDFVTSYQGTRFNSPNDVVVKSDGSIWFSDPGWGCCSGANGVENNNLPQKGEYVYRVSPDGSSVTRISPSSTPYLRPNGLAFSLDESKLYYGNQRNIMVCDVIGSAPWVSGCREFTSQSGSDGLRLDAHGNLWTSHENKVNIYSPQASLIGSINIYNFASYPQQVTNLVFGGSDHKTVFVTGGNKVYYFKSLVRGGVVHPVNGAMASIESADTSGTRAPSELPVWAYALLAAGIAVLVVLIAVVLVAIKHSRKTIERP